MQRSRGHINIFTSSEHDLVHVSGWYFVILDLSNSNSCYQVITILSRVHTFTFVTAIDDQMIFFDII